MAGYADAVGVLRLKGLFIAHMSGNSAKLGVRLTHGKLIETLPLVLAVATFVLSIAVGTAVLELAARKGVRRLAVPVVVLEAGLVAAFMLYGSSRGADDYALIALAVFALGLQASVVQQVRGRVIRTTYVSGVLTSFAQETINALAPPPTRGRRSYVRDVLGAQSRETSRRRAAVLLGVWLLYAGGAVLGGYLDGRWRLWCLALPLGALAVVVLYDLWRPIYA